MACDWGYWSMKRSSLKKRDFKKRAIIVEKHIPEVGMSSSPRNELPGRVDLKSWLPLFRVASDKTYVFVPRCEGVGRFRAAQGAFSPFWDDDEHAWMAWPDREDFPLQTGGFFPFQS